MKDDELISLVDCEVEKLVIIFWVTVTDFAVLACDIFCLLRVKSLLFKE